MKKVIKGTLKEADHNPVRVGDEIVFVKESKGGGGGNGGGGHGGGDKPRPPRGPSRIERVEKTLITFIDEQRKFNKIILSRLDTQGEKLESIDSRLSNVEKRLDKVEQRLDKQDDFNKVVVDYMKSHS